MRIGYLGLGKMGKNHVMRLHEEGHHVIAWNRSKDEYQDIEEFGIETAHSIEDVVASLPTPRVVWVMVTHNAVDAILEDLAPLLTEGDIVIDGGNSHFKESVRRAETLKEKGIMFLDAGVSGGPEGARTGACIMIGGDEAAYEHIKPVIESSSAVEAYQYMGKAGSGHFTKMVHNGIEYGMMQALAEGFNLLKQSDFDINVRDAARIYNSRSVIESRLVGWALEGFKKYGNDLEDVSSVIAHTGEGKWTVETAHIMNEPVPVIETSYQVRVNSENNPHYTGKVVSMLRNMFGGHSINT